MLSGQASIVERLVDKENDEYQTQSRDDGIDPEWPAPAHGRGHKCCQLGPEEGRQHEKGGPEIYFLAAVLVSRAAWLVDRARTHAC